MARPNTFKPSLFIDIGKDQHYYTLRETYLHERYVPGDGPMGNAVVNGVYQGSVEYEVRSFHHYNLSQDPEEALAKARTDAERMGLPMETTRGDLFGRLEDIRRESEAEKLAREQRLAELRAKWDAEREAEKQASLDALKEGRITWGTHKGKTLADMRKGYLRWVVATHDDFEPGSLMRAMADVLLTTFSHLLPPAMKPDAHIGEEGQRLTLDVTVAFVNSYERPKFGADWLTERVYIVTMVTDTGVCVVSKSGAFYAGEGEKLKIKGTVKAHDWYKGQAQTVLNRVAVVEEKK